MRGAALLLALAACGPPPAPPPRQEPQSAARLPERADLPCFPCHAQLKFKNGPPFGHATAAHRSAGHCHVCHVGMGHHGNEIDRAACLGCHQEGSKELLILSRHGTPSK